MKRYFFHLRQGPNLIEDPDGSQIVDLQAAIAEAEDDVRTLIADKVRVGQMIEADAIEVTDADGAVLAVVRYHDVILSLIKR